MESKKRISFGGPYLHSHQNESYNRNILLDNVKRNGSDIVFVDNALDTKKSLIRSIAKSFSFPEYCGENWDAFDECINDLSWLKAKSIAIVLEKADGLLRLPLEDFTIFIKTITGAIDELKREGISLHFVFVCSNAALLQIKRIVGVEIEEWK